MILPQAILDAPPLGCFNLHASLLPRWRGAAPINRAIMAGDTESGVMVMKMDAGLDTGDVAMAERIAITDAMTAADLHDALAPLGADLMVRAMGALERGQLQADEAKRRGRHLRRQDRQGRGADRLEQARARGAAPHSRAVAVSGRVVRDAGRRRACAREDPALRSSAEASGAPGELLDDRLTIACNEGAVRILELQRAGKAADEGGGISARHAAQAAVAAKLMPRYKLIIEYDGAPFCGWQIQDNGAVGAGRAGGRGQGDLRRAGPRPRRGPHRCRRARAGAGRALRHRTSTSCRAGFATASTRICGRIRSACCRPRSCRKHFEARFSAIRRHYRYRIVNRRANLALESAMSGGVPRPLDSDAMHVAAQRLIGKHDFTTFRDTECQAKSPEKTLDQLDVVRNGDNVNIVTSARSFLHSQVRSMVGSLVWVGEGRWTPTICRRAGRPLPRRLRPGRAAGRAVSGAGGLLAAAYNRRHGRQKGEAHLRARRGGPRSSSAKADDPVIAALDAITKAVAYWIPRLRGV